MWVRFYQDGYVSNATFLNDTLILKEGSTLLYDFPKIQFSQNQPYCLITFETFNFTMIDCGTISCNMEQGCRKKNDKSFQIQIKSDKE